MNKKFKWARSELGCDELFFFLSSRDIQVFVAICTLGSSITEYIFQYLYATVAKTDYCDSFQLYFFQR